MDPNNQLYEAIPATSSQKKSFLNNVLPLHPVKRRKKIKTLVRKFAKATQHNKSMGILPSEYQSNGI